MLVKWLSRLAAVLLMSLAVSFTASAQYGGSGGTSSMGYGSSNAKAIGIGVGVGGAAAAVAVVLYVRHRHHEAQKETQSQGQKTSVVTQSEMKKLSLQNDGDLYKKFSSGASPQVNQPAKLTAALTDPTAQPQQP